MSALYHIPFLKLTLLQRKMLIYYFIIRHLLRDYKTFYNGLAM